MSRGEPGLREALTRAGASLLDAFQHRLELASLELGESGNRLLVTLLCWVAALLMFGGAVAMLSAWLAAALWTSVGPAVLGWIALGYALAGGALLLWLRARLHRSPALLADTLAELRGDAAFLREAGGAPSAPERP